MRTVHETSRRGLDGLEVGERLGRTKGKGKTEKASSTQLRGIMEVFEESIPA